MALMAAMQVNLSTTGLTAAVGNLRQIAGLYQQIALSQSQIGRGPGRRAVAAAGAPSGAALLPLGAPAGGGGGSRPRPPAPLGVRLQRALLSSRFTVGPHGIQFMPLVGRVGAALGPEATAA